MSEKTKVTSGVAQLDRLLGGLFIGDNVVWHDDAGSLAPVFCHNFVSSSESQNKPIIYVSFDRSPKNLLDKLGPLSKYGEMTILDCFTLGKGAASPVFMAFYDQDTSQWPCDIIRVEKPHRIQSFMDSLYDLLGGLEGDVRLVFESITGMQELWGQEEQFLTFYAHSCPRLYELDTIAYWVLEKNAHSSRLKAQINQIAQVSIDLSIKRGTTTLSILKAENRDPANLHKPHRYWTKDLNVTFDQEKRTTGRIDLGQRLKELRAKRGLSQTGLAKLVGVSPSTVSQVESSFIYPSLPTLLKMAEVLYVEASSLFQEKAEPRERIIFSASQAQQVKFPHLPESSIEMKLITPIDYDSRAEPYLIEIFPGESIPTHFFAHKGEEMGYLLSGQLSVKMPQDTYTLHPGEVIYLTSDMPSGWENPGPNPATMLWIKVI